MILHSFPLYLSKIVDKIIYCLRWRFRIIRRIISSS